MITPRFSLSQTETRLFVRIKVPHVRATNVQFEVDGPLFVFSLPPYYLRLDLPGRLLEDESMDSRYDLESSEVVCSVSKETPGQVFEDLDLLSKLLVTRAPRKTGLISEVDSDAATEDDSIDFNDLSGISETMGPSTTHYGFNNAYSQVIGVSLHDLNDVNELEDPENMTPDERKKTNYESTQQRFSQQHYLSDFADPEQLSCFIEFVPKREISPQGWDRLLQLGTRKYILANPKETYLGLLQLLFGEAYDYRINLGEDCVESAWNVAKLCPMMACLYNEYTDPKELVVDVTRRSLSFPLYRSYALSCACWKDVLTTLENGRTAILACIERLVQVFASEGRFCYSEIWIQDYARWVPNASKRVLEGLLKEARNAVDSLKKGDLGFDLERLEEGMQAEDMDADSDDESDA